MRLVREYAVEPAAIAIDAQTATQILDLFGWHRGRVVSACPPDWLAQVRALLSANHAIPPVRRKSLVDKKLTYLKENGLVQSRRSWNSNSRWAVEAERQHRAQPFDGVIATEMRDLPGWLAAPADVDAENEVLSANHEIRVERTVDALGDVCRPLLASASRIIFADPYFDPFSPDHRVTFQRWLLILGQLHLRSIPIRVHTSIKHLDAEILRRGIKEHRWAGLLPNGWTCRFYLWREKTPGEHFHARHIVTDRVGVRIDAGLDRGRAGQTTTITCVTPAERRLLFHAFNSESGVYESVGPGFELSSSGYLQEIDDE